MSLPLRRVAAAGFAVTAAGVMIAPTVLMTHTAHRGSAPLSGRELVLVAVSGTIGAGYATLAYRRLSRPTPDGSRRTDMWLAAVHGLVALAVLTPAFLGLLLYQLGSLQPWFGQRSAALVLVWAMVQVAAIAGAELTGRLVARWLRSPGADSGADRRAVPDPRRAVPDRRPEADRGSPPARWFARRRVGNPALMSDEPSRADVRPTDEPDGTSAFAASLRPAGESLSPEPGAAAASDPGDEFADEEEAATPPFGRPVLPGESRAGYDVEDASGPTGAARPR